MTAQTPDTPSELRHSNKSRASSGATTPNGYPFPDLPFPGLIPTHPHSHGPLDDETFFDLSERGIPVTLTRRRSGSATTHASPLVRRPNLKSAVRPSLLGAIEFRDVVNSLRADSSARTLAVFGSGTGDDRHMHASAVGSESGTSSSLHHHKRSSSHTGAVALHSHPTSPSIEGRPRGKSVYEAGLYGWASSEGGPWNDEEGDEEEVLRDQTGQGQLIDLSRGVEDPWRGAAREPLQVRIPSLHSRNSSQTLSPMHRSKSEPARPPIRRVPSILLTTDAGEEETVLAAPSSPNPSARSLANRQRFKIMKAVFLALFPSLQDFSEKSYLGRATAILCVPAILLLNLTLPVVDDAQDDCDSIEEKERHCEEEEGSYRDEYETPNSRGLLIDHTVPQSVQDDREARTTRKAIAHEFHSNVIPHPAFGDLTQEAAVDLHGVDQSLLSQAERGQTTLMTEEEEQEQSKRTALNLNGYLLTADVPVEADRLIRWLTAVQCTLAPIFCSTALFSQSFHSSTSKFVLTIVAQSAICNGGIRSPRSESD